MADYLTAQITDSSLALMSGDKWVAYYKKNTDGCSNKLKGSLYAVSLPNGDVVVKRVVKNLYNNKHSLHDYYNNPQEIAGCNLIGPVSFIKPE